jgi:hypothetical protein
MKSVLKISLGFNIVLAVFLLWLGGRRWLSETSSGRATGRNEAGVGRSTELETRCDFMEYARVGADAGSATAADDLAKSGSQESQQRRSLPFQWAQIESTDYRTYVANLRGIGCPERTIRDIIIADVNGLYFARREKLRRSELAAGSSNLVSPSVLAARLQELQAEETAVIETLLDPRQASGRSAAFAVTSFRDRGKIPEESAVIMPLVFQTVASESLKPDEQQLRVLAGLRQRFQEEIGGPNQDPNDSAYRERWQAAQRTCDELVQALLGGEFYVNYQLEASRGASMQPHNP